MVQCDPLLKNGSRYIAWLLLCYALNFLRFAPQCPGIHTCTCTFTFIEHANFVMLTYMYVHVSTVCTLYIQVHHPWIGSVNVLAVDVSSLLTDLLDCTCTCTYSTQLHVHVRILWLFILKTDSICYTSEFSIYMLSEYPLIPYCLLTCTCVPPNPSSILT